MIQLKQKKNIEHGVEILGGMIESLMSRKIAEDPLSQYMRHQLEFVMVLQHCAQIVETFPSNQQSVGL